MTTDTAPETGPENAILMEGINKWYGSYHVAIHSHLSAP